MKLVYRILCAVFSFAILPVVFFVPIVRVKINTPIDLGLREYTSIFSIIRSAAGRTEEQKELIKQLLSGLTDKNSTLGAVFTNRPFLYAFLVFFVITVVVAIVLGILSIMSKKPGVLIGVAAGGLLSGFLMNSMFTSFAKPLLSGEINLTSFLGGSDSDTEGLAALLGGLLRNAVSVEQLKLSFAYLLIMLLFMLVVFTCVWAIMEKD